MIPQSELHHKHTHRSKNKFEESLQKLIFKIKSLHHTLPILEHTLSTEISKQEKELKLLSPKIKNQLRTENIDVHTFEKFIRQRETRNYLLHTNHSIREQFLISFITHLDTFLAETLKDIYTTIPELLSVNDKNSPTGKNINYSKIMTFKSIDDVKDFIIEQEVEELLRSSITNFFEYLEKRSNLKLINIIPRWGELIEIDERRNILVHSDGIVSEQYINVCKKNSSLPSNIKKGDHIYIDREYINCAYSCLTETAIIISQLTRRKLQPNDLFSSDEDFERVTFALLEEKEYQMAKNVLDFGQVHLNKHASEEFRLNILINKAIACKFSNNNIECQKLLDSEDWTAKDDIYKLAVSILKEEYKKASQLMLTIHSSKLSKEVYQEWPLFLEFRYTKEFLEAYKKLFKQIYKPVL